MITEIKDLALCNVLYEMHYNRCKERIPMMVHVRLASDNVASLKLLASGTALVHAWASDASIEWTSRVQLDCALLHLSTQVQRFIPALNVSLSRRICVTRNLTVSFILCIAICGQGVVDTISTADV